jgi:hypothetical protein
MLSELKITGKRVRKKGRVVMMLPLLFEFAGRSILGNHSENDRAKAYPSISGTSIPIILMVLEGDNRGNRLDS